MTVNKYAIVDGDQVVNVILLDEDSDYIPPAGNLIIPATDDVSIGWTRSGNEWVAPQTPAEPNPVEDPDVTAAKNDALAELIEIGLSPATARRILGLPAEE